jgi:hypothetical protein
MNFDVFVSHANADRKIAESICSALETHDISCWVAPRDLLPGIQYAEAIVDAISRCRLLVLVFSSHANTSPHVSREIERAASKDIPIVTIKIEQTSLSASMEYFLSQSHWMEAFEEDAQHYLPQIVEALSALLLKIDPSMNKQDLPIRQAVDSTDDYPNNLLHEMWDNLDSSLQDAFALAFNKKCRERKARPTRISTRDLFQALARIHDDTLQQLLKALPEEALPEPVDDSVTYDRQVLQEETLLSDCVAESLENFNRVKDSARKVTPTDLFVDISKHGHGPSVSQLREHGVGPAEIEDEIRRLGLDNIIRREA